MSRSTILVFVLFLTFLLQLVLPPVSSAGLNKSYPAIEDSLTLEEGEWIEAPADANVRITLGNIGSAILAAGGKVQIRMLPAGAPLLSVASGELVVGLQPQAKAFIKIGDALFSASSGALFHAGIRDGKAFVDASEDLKTRVSAMGNWAIQVPPLTASNAATRQTGAPVVPPGRINPSASPNPIGRIESLGVVKINQRAASRGELLWGNELLQAPKGGNARASLNGLGQVSLNGGAEARVTTRAIGGTGGRRVLATSLFAGSIVVQLNPGVAGYAEAAGATFLAAKGARFRVLLVEGRAIFEMADGVGFEAGQWLSASPLSLAAIAQSVAQNPAPLQQRRYLVRPVGLSSNLVIKARSARQIQVRVTDEEDNKPVRGLPVIFLLGGSGGGAATVGAFSSGSNTARAFTDQNGIASVDFVAASTVSVGSITATVEGTNNSWTGQINLFKAEVGFWTPQNAIPVLTTLGAAVTIGAIKAATKEDTLQINSTGPTIIKP